MTMRVERVSWGAAAGMAAVLLVFGSGVAAAVILTGRSAASPLTEASRTAKQPAASVVAAPRMSQTAESSDYASTPREGKLATPLDQAPADTDAPVNARPERE